MAGLNGHEIETRSYDTNLYLFREALTRAAYESYMPGDDFPPLENLHIEQAWQSGATGWGPVDLSQVHTREADQQAKYYADLYSAYHPLRPAFRLAYLDFLMNEVRPLFGETIVYQKVPTLRVQMLGNVAVGEYHTDAKYGHPTESVNFWVPVTNASGSNALHIQTSEDERPRPRNVSYGEYLVFDGIGLPHGNERNVTDQTRVSFDFRVIPVSQFKPSDRTSINAGLAFRTGVGGYYDLLTDERVEDLRNEIAEAARPALEWEARLQKALDVGRAGRRGSLARVLGHYLRLRKTSNSSASSF